MNNSFSPLMATSYVHFVQDAFIRGLLVHTTCLQYLPTLIYTHNVSFI